MPKRLGPTPALAYPVVLGQLRQARAAAMVAARLLDVTHGVLRERLVEAGGFTAGAAEDFERLADVSSSLAMVGCGEPVPKLLREPAR